MKVTENLIKNPKMYVQINKSDRLKRRYRKIVIDNYILLYEFVKKGYGMAFVNIEYYKDVIGKDNVSVIFPSLTICARKIICLTSKETSNKVLNKFVDIINE